MINGESDFIERRREAFELWQWSADEIYQQWARSPLCLQGAGVALERLLDFFAFYRRLSDALGRPPESLSAASDEFSSLATAYSQSVLAAVSAAAGRKSLPPVAATPHTIVHCEDRVRLLRYQASEPKRYTVPLLILGSPVNRHYILDLTPGRSYLEYLLGQGFDVYAIDWGTPDAGDAGLTIEDYIERYILRAVRAVMRQSKVKHLSLLGYSMGGVLALCYTALHPAQVKNLVLLATPIDFSSTGLVRDWTDGRYFDMDKLADTFGNVPAWMIRWSFLMLKPYTNATKYLSLLDRLGDDEYVRDFLALERWIYDGAAVPGAFFKRFVKDFYRDNLLIKGALKIAGEKVELSRVTCPVLNVIGEKDQTVAPASSAALMSFIASEDKEQLVLPYGHVTMSVAPGAAGEFWPKSAAWLKKRSGEVESLKASRSGRSKRVGRG